MQERDLIKKTHIRYLVSYLAVFLIPVLLSIVIYKNLVDLLVKDSLNANMAILEQSRIIIDQRMAELDSIAWNIATNGSVSRLLYSPSQTPEMITDAFNKMRADFYSYKASNNFIADYFIYFKYIDSVTILDTLYKPGEYYRYFQKVYTNWQTGYDQWYNFIRGEYSEDKTVMTLESNTENGDSTIMFVYKLPLYTADLSLGSLGIIINNVQLKALMQNAVEENRGFFYLLDQNGKTIACSGGSAAANLPELEFKDGRGTEIANVNGHNMLVTYVKSSHLGWKYIIAVPQESVMAKANSIKNGLLLIIVLCLLYGLIVSFVFASGYSKPLKYLLDDIVLQVKKTEQLPCNDTYGFIKGAFMQLAAESTVQEDMIKKQMPILTDNFYTKLIKGEIRSDEEIRRYELILNLKLDAKAFSILLFYIENFKNMEVAGLAIIGEIQHFVFDASYTLTIDGKTICLLVGFNTCEEDICKEEMRKFALEARNNLYLKYEMPVTIAIGGLKDKKDIYGSYEEAVIALRYGQFLGENSIIWSDEINKADGIDYYYPPEEEVRLMNSVRAGNFEAVNAALDGIYKKNFVEKRLKPTVAEYLVNDLKSTLVKLLSELIVLDGMKGSFESILAELKECNTGGETFLFIRKFFINACGIINLRKKSHNDILRDNIEAYLSASYTQKDLSLSSIAERFNISEPYLSKFFVQHIGENFSVYVGRLRIKKAESLLLGSESTLEQIAENTGFGSVHVFIKVFKKYTGLTPGAYKSTFKL